MLKHLKCLLIPLLYLQCTAMVHADIRIYGLEDFDLGRWVLGAGSINSSANICVAVRPRGPYQITAYGQGPSNAFVLLNAGNTLPYRMFFNDRPRRNGAEELIAGQVLGGLRGRRGRGIRRACNRPTANITIRIEESDLQQATAGSYSGTILIVVGPE